MACRKMLEAANKKIGWLKDFPAAHSRLFDSKEQFSPCKSVGTSCFLCVHAPLCSHCDEMGEREQCGGSSK